MVVDHGRYYNTGNWSWHLKFAWLPAKMDNGSFIWWKEYYHGVRLIFGPVGEEPVVLHQYLTTQEHLFNLLKNN